MNFLLPGVEEGGEDLRKQEKIKKRKERKKEGKKQKKKRKRNENEYEHEIKEREDQAEKAMMKERGERKERRDEFIPPAGLGLLLRDDGHPSLDLSHIWHTNLRLIVKFIFNFFISF
jgi:hypothetical protein